MSTPTPKVANLRSARKEQAAAKATTRQRAAKPPTAAPAPEKAAPKRKAPATSGKAKLRWDGDVAKANGEEVGKRVEQSDGTYHAAVKANGKTEILATGVSVNRAYAIVTAFYHRGERPAAKKTG